MKIKNRYGAKALLVAAILGNGFVLPITATLAVAAPIPCRGCFGVVNADGGFNRGKGVVRVDHFTTGDYEVIFNEPVNTCAFQSTLARADVSGQSAGFLQVFNVSGSNKGVRIVINASNEVTLADRGFHLSVSCP
jgi:hypothetical protein